ncbi:unnamed protein product [Auanema sp. JU1783]|nr:unnamed protein product [Auanema sp. JU1783]
MRVDTVQPKYTLLDLGYHFNSSGELRTVEGDEPFQYTSQEEYEILGDAMTHEVYDLLEKLGLQRIVLKKPIDAGSDSEFSFVFGSPHFELKPTLLVLLHGSGAVRAGQWGRRLIMNENLDRGSQIPYIERAMANEWGVLVMNTNNNIHLINEHEVPLRYSKDSGMHAVNCWYRFVKYARASRIYVVAHSRGGQDISRIVDEFPNDNRIEVVCLTDANFQFSNSRASHPVVINWAAQPLCSLVKPILGDPKNLSDRVHQLWAGTNEHDRSSYIAFDSIFHILERYDRRTDMDCLLHEAWNIIEDGYNRVKSHAEVLAHPNTASYVAADYVVQEGIITDFNVSGDIVYDDNDHEYKSERQLPTEASLKRKAAMVKDDDVEEEEDEEEEEDDDSQLLNHRLLAPVSKKVMLSEKDN